MIKARTIYPNEVADYEIEFTQKQGVHLGWWLFWFIVFAPALIFVLISHISAEDIHLARVELWDGECYCLEVSSSWIDEVDENLKKIGL